MSKKTRFAKKKINFKNPLKSLKIKKRFSFIGDFFKDKPFTLLSLLFMALLALIVVGFLIRSQKPEEIASQVKAKMVDIYHIGQSPTLRVLAKVEKENVITIVAQKPGIVQKLYVKEGDHVQSRGTTLAYVSDNYQGGNAASVNKELAQKRFEKSEVSYEINKEIIAKDRELLEQKDINQDELRKIKEKSIQDTKDLIGLDEEIVSYFDRNIELYEATNSADVNRDDIAGAKQLKHNYAQALNQLRNSVRQFEYEADSDNPPIKIEDIDREKALKSLELKEKAFELNKEIAGLGVRLARVSAATAYPASISNGDIEKIHVRIGQAVNPGTPLFTMSGCDRAVTATAYVAADIAAQVSQYNSASLFLGNHVIEQAPVFISGEAVQGLSYAVKFAIPENYYDSLTDKEYIEVDLPIGYPDTGSTIPFVPIDSIYQSSESSFIFINKDGVAKSQKIELGEVYGQFVAVVSGLEEARGVILDRTVIDGDLVEVETHHDASVQ